MGNIYLEILLILLLILANGFLAMSEIAVVSARKVRLQQRAAGGNASAQAALALAESPGRFLSTVQIGITLVGILAGAFGGATIARTLEPVLQQVDFLRPYAEGLSLGIVVLLITYLSLVIGELVPKQIGLTHSERIAAFVARPMKAISWITAPVVSFLTASTNLVTRFLGLHPSNEPSITEEEIRLLIGQGRETGVFEAIEEELVEQVFRLGDRRVSSLTTPYPDVIWLDLEDSPQVTRNKMISSPHSHFPVAAGSLDNLLGFVRANDLLAQTLEGREIDIRSVLQPPLFIPENMPAFSVLERMKEDRSQIAFAIDEYGGIQGLITLRDILEALVGEIPEADEVTDPDIVQRDDGSWLLDGMLPVEEFKDLFDLDDLPGEEANYFQTLGGFVMTYLGQIPNPGDHVEWQGLRIEVMDMDGNRVDKILVVPEEKDQT